MWPWPQANDNFHFSSTVSPMRFENWMGGGKGMARGPEVKLLNSFYSKYLIMFFQTYLSAEHNKMKGLFIFAILSFALVQMRSCMPIFDEDGLQEDRGYQTCYSDCRFKKDECLQCPEIAAAGNGGE